MARHPKAESYIMVYESERPNLEAAVRDNIKLGYVPIGGGNINSNYFYTQAMVAKWYLKELLEELLSPLFGTIELQLPEGEWMSEVVEEGEDEPDASEDGDDDSE